MNLKVFRFLCFMVVVLTALFMVQLTDVAASDVDAEIAAMLEEVNMQLEALDLNYRVVVAEYITSGEGDAVGNTVIAKEVGSPKLDSDFVPFDDRRAWSGPPAGSTDDITYAVDQVDAIAPPGILAADTTAAIDRAMASWDELDYCSDLSITKNSDFPIPILDLGVMAYILTFGSTGGPFVVADYMHAGWWDLDFGGTVIAMTYTFAFIDSFGFTDINNDGRLDVAFRETYYDPSWIWDIDNNVDVETVALHEAGHGLSQDHFGMISLINGNLKVSPRAVMNPVYLGVQQSLLRNDLAGHCANWADWPNH